ncbi:MAG: hypothetical protein A2992_03600 [Elusimicrobia bacterium RIFCSPLOWO2_01_FULL_59_12]|nr:MAG: hypothetical protein A2992_03600 [Elusimicrobia bacterium RIFCSPLOWO2_01_FULL_59_12]
MPPAPPPLSTGPASMPSAAAPIPFPPGGHPVGAMPPGMPGMPPLPAGQAGASGRSLEQRLQDMERRHQEQEESKRKLEERTRDLEARLKDEHEKVILQSLKAKEEESLSVRVDQQLREMQEKLRREKYEQELQESRGKAETQLKDLERRIAEERETWMTALKNQLKEREAVEHEVEENLTRRLRDMEQRYQEEKNQWVLSIKQKEDELSQERQHFELELEKWKEMLEDREEEANRVKEAAVEDQRKTDIQHQAEYRALQAQYETQMRETGSWKAQVAMVQSQVQQLEMQQQQDRTRLDAQLRAREDELKREFSLRDHERTQYWEGIMNQLKAEKDAARAASTRLEDETERLRIEALELKRQLEKERGEWQAGIENARRLAREEALRDLPQAFEDRMKAVQLQLVKAGEAQKLIQSKLDVEQRRWDQHRTLLVEGQQQLEREKAHLSGELQRIKADFEKQTKELFHHIAESQMKEAAIREEAEKQKLAYQERQDAYQNEKEKLEGAIATSLRDAYEKEELAKRYESEIEQLKSQFSEFTRQADESQAREELMKGSQAQLTTAFHNVQNELVKLQNNHIKKESEWAEKETAWQKSKAEWDKTLAELEKTKSADSAGVVSTDTLKALAAIRQNMQDLRTALAGLRP